MLARWMLRSASSWRGWTCRYNVKATTSKTTIYCLGFGLALKRHYLACCLEDRRSADASFDQKLLFYTNLSQRGTSRNILVAAILGTVAVLRVLVRILWLAVAYGPVLICYPLVRRSSRLRRRWWSVVYWLVERSGPAVIKLAQWSSTRRDLFSAEFCDLFSKLHTSAPPHSWANTEKALNASLGVGWRDFLEISDLCGSGCIAQVYRAKLDRKALQHLYPELNAKFKSPKKSSIDVAIKVTHPNVKRAVNDDLQIMQFLAMLTKFIVPTARYMDPSKCVAEFRTVLLRQLDMRYEGDALYTFSKQFQDDESVRFPVPLFQTENVLIETFETGEQMSAFLANPDVDLKKQVGLKIVDSLLKMVFVHNFIHGDLHPGNILVQNYDFQRPADTRQRWVPQIIRNFLGFGDGGIILDQEAQIERRTRLVFLDAGISVRLNPRDLDNLRGVFSNVVEGQGMKVAELMLANAPQQYCKDVDGFKRDINELVNRTRTIVNLQAMDVSRLLSDLMSTVSRYRVSLETNFTCVVLAILVLEGLGRQMHPQLDLLEQARPILMRIALENQ